MEEKNPIPFEYSWGEFYNTLKEMEKNGDRIEDENLLKTFSLIEKLDNAKSEREIWDIVAANKITKYEQNRINSSCLDGILVAKPRYSWEGLDDILFEPKYIEAAKFFIIKASYNYEDALKKCLSENNTELALVLIPLCNFGYFWGYEFNSVLKFGNIILMEALEKHGYKFDIWTVKHAIKNNSLDAIRFFANRNYDCDIILCICVEERNCNCTELLLTEYKNKVNVNLFHHGQTLLTIACKHNIKPGVIDLLLRHGANIHADDEEALVRASEHGRMKVVKFLLKNGAIVTDRAISLAANYNRKDIIKILRNHRGY
jgi:hypothetical protein